MFEIDSNKIRQYRIRYSFFSKSLERYSAGNYIRGIDQEYLFIHIPKTAGMSVKKYYGLMNNGHAPYFIHKERNVTRYHAAYKFAVFRDPVERFASAYKFLSEGGVGSVDSKYSKIIRANRNLDGFVDAMKIKRNRIFDIPHFKPMSYYVGSEKGGEVEFHLKQNTLANDVEKFDKLIGNDNESVFPMVNVASNDSESLILSDRIKKEIEILYAEDYELISTVKHISDFVS